MKMNLSVRLRLRQSPDIVSNGFARNDILSTLDVISWTH